MPDDSEMESGTKPLDRKDGPPARNADSVDRKEGPADPAQPRAVTGDVVTRLAGWGKYPVVKARVRRPEKIAALADLVAMSSGSSLLARGLGRSYGDASMNMQGRTVLMERLNRMIAFNAKTGILRCEAGVTFHDILEVFVPRGWFPAVTPGTKFVTMGGAAAFDVHGKNHHRNGSFSNFIESLTVLLASGEMVRCSRTQYSDLFWATIGGMGLTGVITEMEVVLRPIETAYIKALTIKAKSLDEAFALFDEHEPRYQYSVAWIDCLAGGASLGRSVVMFGNHASPADLPHRMQAEPFRTRRKIQMRVPFDLPSFVLNRHTASAFNALYYKIQADGQEDSIDDFNSFFYPLDGLLEWNRVYGPRGFVQYQCVFPPDVSREALVRLLEMCSKKGLGSFLAVLKRFGRQDGWMQFPMPGYTLAMDIPMRPTLLPVLDEMDQLVLQYGGRVYLAKDARMSPESFRAMYPGYPKWLEFKARVDPSGIFSSALSERLRIHTR